MEKRIQPVTFAKLGECLGLSGEVLAVTVDFGRDMAYVVFTPEFNPTPEGSHHISNEALTTAD